MSFLTGYSPSTVPAMAVWTVLLLWGLQLLRTYTKLWSVPGPFIASLSNGPRLYWTWTRKQYRRHIDLHEQYGKLVRLGPNMVSVADPTAIPTIYGFNYDFQKVRVGNGHY